jgi:hypothetical protein
VCKGDDLTTFIGPEVEKIRSVNVPDPQGPAQACSGRTLPLPLPLQLKYILSHTIFASLLSEADMQMHCLVYCCITVTLNEGTT